MSISIPAAIKPFVKQALHGAERLGHQALNRGVDRAEQWAVGQLPRAGQFAMGHVDRATDRGADVLERMSDKFIDSAVDRASQFKYVGGLVQAHRGAITRGLDNVVNPHAVEGRVDQFVADKVLPRAQGVAAGLIDRGGDKVADVGSGLLSRGFQRLGDWLKV